MNKKMNIKYFLIMNISILLFLLSTCEVFSPGLGEKVDIEAPVVGIESHGNGDYIGGIVELSGYVSDDSGISSVTLSHNSNVYTAVVSEESWSIDVDTSAYQDGEFDFALKATDTAGKEYSTSVLLIVDNNPPTVLVTVPTTYGIDKEFNKNIVIKGEASDTTRVKEILIALYRVSDNSAVFTDKKATGTSSWYYIFDAGPSGYNLDEACYFSIKAADFSGNINTYFYHFADILDNASDSGDLPNVEDINSAEHQGNVLPGTLTVPLSTIRKSETSGQQMVITIDPNSDYPQFSFISPSEIGPNPLSSPQRFSGFIEDDDGLVKQSSAEISIYEYLGFYDDANPVALDADGAGDTATWVSYGLDLNSTQWTYESDLATGKEYYLRLRAEDINGVSNTSSPVLFSVPEGVPGISVLTPQQGSYVGNSSVLDFEIKINNMSTGSLYMDLTPSDSWADAIVYNQIDLAGIHLRTEADGEVYGISLISGTDFTLNDGVQSFNFRAGIAGGFGQISWQYVGDSQVPTINISYPNEYVTASDSVNGIISITGSSDDGLNPLEGVYLKIEPGWNPAAPAPADFSSWLTPVGLSNWTVSGIDTTDLSIFTAGDGDYTLRY